MKITGFVILSPNMAEAGLYYAYSTFGITSAEAWSRWLRSDYDDPDRSIKIQRAHDRGYRVRRVTMELVEEDE